MDYDSLLELLKNRRSIRRFKLDPVPDEYVDKIIEAARWAPSGFNSQPWEFVVVRKQELKDRIVQLIDGPKSQRIRAEAEATRELWQGPHGDHRLGEQRITVGQWTIVRLRFS